MYSKQLLFLYGTAFAIVLCSMEAAQGMLKMRRTAKTHESTNVRESTNLKVLKRLEYLQKADVLSHSELQNMKPEDRAQLVIIHQDEHAANSDEEASSGATHVLNYDDNNEESRSSDNGDSLVEQSVRASAEPAVLSPKIVKPNRAKRRTFRAKREHKKEGEDLQKRLAAIKECKVLTEQEWEQELSQAPERRLLEQLSSWVLENADLITTEQLEGLLTLLIELNDLEQLGINFKKKIERKSLKKQKLTREEDKARKEEEKAKKIARYLNWSQFKLPKAYFKLLLDLSYAYSEKLFEEATSSILNPTENGDLPQIITTALDTHPQAPHRETELISLLRNVSDGQTKGTLIQLLQESIKELYTEKMVPVEQMQEIDDALNKLDRIQEQLHQQGSFLTDGHTFNSFVEVHGAKLGTAIMDSLLARALEIDTAYGAQRPDKEESAYQMLQGWVLRNYVTKEGEETEPVQKRVSSESYKKILNVKETVVLKKPFLTRLINRWTVITDVSGKEGVAKQEALAGLMRDML